MKKSIALMVFVTLLYGCSSLNSNQNEVVKYEDENNDPVTEYKDDMFQTMQDVDMILAAIRGTAKTVNSNPAIVNDPEFIESLDSLSNAIRSTCDYFDEYEPKSNDERVQAAH